MCVLHIDPSQIIRQQRRALPDSKETISTYTICIHCDVTCWCVRTLSHARVHMVLHAGKLRVFNEACSNEQHPGYHIFGQHAVA